MFCTPSLSNSWTMTTEYMVFLNMISVDTPGGDTWGAYLQCGLQVSLLYLLVQNHLG